MKTIYGVVLISLGLLSTTSFALNCNNAMTQADIDKCAAQDRDKADKALNKTYNEYRALLSNKEKEELKQVQLAWIKFRDLDCKFQASSALSTLGGEIYPMIMADCASDKAIKREKELKEMLKDRREM